MLTRHSEVRLLQSRTRSFASIADFRHVGFGFGGFATFEAPVIMEERALSY